MPQTQHTARKTGGDDASKTRSDASGRDDTAAAHASKKEKLLYNLKNHVYAQQFRSIHVPGEVGIVAIRDIPNETDPFILCNIPKNPEVINIRQSSLVGIVSDHVKKFITPHITIDGEKEYPINVIDLQGANIKFYVKTTNDANQSNCKYTQGPSGYMTIMTTRLIKKGDEMLLFYEMPN
jgi:hypothetical protein